MPIYAPRSGQSLIELLVAIAVGALFVVAAAAVIAPSLRENTQAANVQTGTALGKELLDNVRVWSEQNWHNMLALATGSINTYYLNTAASPFQLVTAASATFPNGYAYRRTITIPGSQVSQVNGTILTNFPVLISTVSAPFSDMAASSQKNGTLQSAAGNDIYFTADPSGTIPLYAEQESYSSSTGAIAYWVQVPTLSSTTNNPIYMFYDKPSVPSAGYFPQQVWDGNYKGVYHLANLASVVPDSTNNGANGSSTTGATATAGEIDGGANFNAASSQYVSMPINLSGSRQVTAEFWLYQSNFVTNAIAAGFTSNGLTTSGGFDVEPSDGSKLEIWATGNAITNGVTYTRPSAGAWHDYVFAENLTVPTNQINLYIDGVPGSVPNRCGGSCNGDNTTALPNSTFYLMTMGNGTYFNTGIEDELRVSNNIRSADWINTEYRNESNPGAFYTVGSASTAANTSNLTENITLGGTTYSRYFYITDVYRSSTGTIVASGGTYDPSSKQVVVKYSWPGGGGGTLATILTRNQNFVFDQTDWSGGSGQIGPMTFTNSRFATSTNISYASTAGSILLPITGSSPAMVGFLDSTTLDTGIALGAQLNSLLWHGSLPGGTSVGFQFATSSSSGGPWSYTGSDGTINSFYTTQPGVPLSLPYTFTGIQYFRYRVTLTSDPSQTLTPRVDDININWSP